MIFIGLGMHLIFIEVALELLYIQCVFFFFIFNDFIPYDRLSGIYLAFDFFVRALYFHHCSLVSQTFLTY